MKKRANRYRTEQLKSSKVTHQRHAGSVFVLAFLLLTSPAIGQEPSEEMKINALKLGYLLNGSSMTRHPHYGSIDVSRMSLESPHIREIPLDKPIFPKADDPEAPAVEGPLPSATSVHKKKSR